MDFLCYTHFYVPLDGLHADGAHCIDRVVVVIAVGQADQCRAYPGDLFNFVVAGVQVGHYLVGGELGVVGMGVGVVHHLVARIVEGLYRLRIFVYPFTHHKKGGGNIVLPQNVDELLGVLIAPW